MEIGFVEPGEIATVNHAAFDLLRAGDAQLLDLLRDNSLQPWSRACENIEWRTVSRSTQCFILFGLKASFHYIAFAISDSR